MARLWIATFVIVATFGAPAVVIAQETVVAEEAAVTAWTFNQACCGLKTLCPGKQHLTFIHPFTCCPVDVCFCLPCGCYELICKDGCLAKKLVFKYKGLGNDVVIKFKKDGSVVVN